MVHENSLKNLKPCAPGETHNPNGRPPGAKNLTTRIIEMLEQIPSGKQETYYQLLATRVVQLAISKGNWNAIKEIWDRLEGKPIQRNELTGEGGAPVQVNIRLNPASTLLQTPASGQGERGSTNDNPLPKMEVGL